MAVKSSIWLSQKSYMTLQNRLFLRLQKPLQVPNPPYQGIAASPKTWYSVVTGIPDKQLKQQGSANHEICIYHDLYIHYK